MTATTTTINVTCPGCSARRGRPRTVEQYHDKYATGWETTREFGSNPYGSERKVLRVPGADPGDDTRMKVVITCDRCGANASVRWERLHSLLDEARATGQTHIPMPLN